MTNAAAPLTSKPDPMPAIPASRPRRLLPKLDDIPIPRDVAIRDGWSPALTELADWIGPYDALRLCERLGGEQVYVPRDIAGSPFASFLAPDKVAVLADIYGGSRWIIPVGSKALRQARRAAVIAACRARMVSGRDAAIILGTTRSHMAALVNQTAEGISTTAALPPEPVSLTILKCVASTVLAEMATAGVEPSASARAWAAIMALWEADGLPPPVRRPGSAKVRDRRISVLDRMVADAREAAFAANADECTSFEQVSDPILRSFVDVDAATQSRPCGTAREAPSTFPALDASYHGEDDGTGA